MKVASWHDKRALLLASLSPFDPGADARRLRLQEALRKKEEENLLKAAQSIIDAEPVLDVPEPIFDDQIAHDTPAEAALPSPAQPEITPAPSYLDGDLPDPDLPIPGKGPAPSNDDPGELPPSLLED